MKLKQNKQSKLVVALSAVILLLVALSATLTFAYFTATTGSKSSGAMTFGVLKLNVGDVSTSTTTSHNHTLVPGCEIALSGEVKQIGNVKSYVRLTVGCIVALDNSNPIIAALDSNEKQTKIDEYQNTLQSAIQNALQIADGTNQGVAFTKDATRTETGENPTGLYYGTVAPANDATATTETVVIDLSRVTVNLDKETIGNVYQGATITITVTVDAIQADHAFGSKIDNPTTAQIADSAAWTTVSQNGVKSN